MTPTCQSPRLWATPDCARIGSRPLSAEPHMKLIGIRAAASMALLALSGHGAVSQTARTIRIVVPFPAGGSADDLARLLADQVGRTRGVSVVIENRPGAGTIVASEMVSRAAPDGNT